jgi:hypothetical protein
MDILKMMWALLVEGDHRVVDVAELGFDLAWARYVTGAEVNIERKTVE